MRRALDSGKTPVAVTSDKQLVKRRAINPWRAILLYFVGLIVIGTVLLMLPFSSATGNVTTPLTAFFTSTSAVCVTGLVVVDTGSYWSTFGHIVLLVLMQFGGLGFASSSFFVLLLFHQKLKLSDRILLKAASGVKNQHMSTPQLVGRIIRMALIIEAIGAIFLFIGWVGEVGPLKAAWWGIFHSVAAFTNSGFDILGTSQTQFPSLTGYYDNPIVCLTISGLILVGGIGFIVLIDIREVGTNRRLSLYSQLLLLATAALVIFGTIFIWLAELGNPKTLGNLTFGEQLIGAFFHAVSPRTAGFNSLDLVAMTTPTILLIMMYMFIGGGSSSTAGGMKLSTLIVVIAALFSIFQNRKSTQVNRKTIPQQTVNQALAIGAFHTFSIGITVFILSITENISLRYLTFEVISAYSTVGLTLGATPNTTPFGQIVLALAMFIGRLGPIILLIALGAPQRASRIEYPQEDMAVG
jgi:trk system potassium uptake protein